MDSESSNNELTYSDEEIDEAEHKKLVSNILNLSYKQLVKRSTRTEPTLKVSEFDLVKTGKNVHIADLANVLEKKNKQQNIGKNLKRVEQKLSTLPKPLEKPQAERIHRTVAYKKTQNELGKWDPIVSAIRSSAHTTFPLHADSKLDDKVDSLGADWGYKSELQKELEAVESKDEVYVMSDVDENEFPMTMEEIKEKRSEAARMRAHESYKIAKARRQNKIKSKKFHRVQKKEKMKQKMKEFELLQKTNPEAALEKLQEIERARAEERMSLRHKSTGQWAKSKLVRAKYDKETRQELAQQLSINRDLTQKLKTTDDSDEEYEDIDEESCSNSTPDNPWLNSNIKVNKEVNDFASNYKKFSEQVKGDNENINAKSTRIQKDNLKEVRSLYYNENIQTPNADVEDSNSATETSRKRKLNDDKSGTSHAKVQRVLDTTTSEWQVTSADEPLSIDLEQEFNKLEFKLRQRLDKKVTALKHKAKVLSSRVRKNRKTPDTSVSNPTELERLSLPKQILRPIIDEELHEASTSKYNAEIGRVFEDIKTHLLDGEKFEDGSSKSAFTDEIDPDKYIKTKTTKLNTAVPDLLEFDDNEEVDQRGLIAEAFQDDDVVDEFQKEKKDEVDASNPKNIDLNLPGWGAWGGKNIKESARKRRRFIVNFPEKMKRKDSNKGNLIINENTNSKVRAHLVSEVPFPFKNVKDYEASIRAPIGNTFVPETAFRRLVEPSVTTRMGTVIEPMSKDILVKKKH